MIRPQACVNLENISDIFVQPRSHGRCECSSLLGYVCVLVCALAVEHSHSTLPLVWECVCVHMLITAWVCCGNGHWGFFQILSHRPSSCEAFVWVGAAPPSPQAGQGLWPRLSGQGPARPCRSHGLPLSPASDMEREVFPTPLYTHLIILFCLALCLF